MLRTLSTKYGSISGVHDLTVWAEKGNASCLVSGYLTDSAAMEAVSRVEDQSFSPPPWTARRLFVGKQIFESTPPSPRVGPAFFTIYMQPPAELDEEFNAWYNTEHVPRLMTVPGCMGALRFKENGVQPTYVAVYYLTNPEVWGCEAWREAADTPWRAWVMNRVKILGGRTVYSRIQE